MYTYTAGATGFTACLPPAAMDGGYEALFRRLRRSRRAAKILAAMKAAPEGWENLCRAAGSPERLLLVEFKTEALKPLTGKTLAAVAPMRGKDPDETILDLILEDRTRVGVVFFLMSEDNVRRQVRLPWVSFGSDAASMAPEGVFLKSSAHPRAYGNFARLLGRYVRDEKLITARGGDPAAGRPARGEPRPGRSRRAAQRRASPTSWSSIRRRWRTARPSTTRTSTRWACGTCS